LREQQLLIARLIYCDGRPFNLFESGHARTFSELSTLPSSCPHLSNSRVLSLPLSTTIIRPKWQSDWLERTGWMWYLMHRKTSMANVY
jgi:hypothetical protein